MSWAPRTVVGAARMAGAVTVLAVLLVAGGRALPEDQPSGGNAAGDAMRPGAPVPTPAAERSGFDAAREQYLSVLERAAAGDTDSAIAVADLERSTYAAGSLADLARLQRFQLSAVAALAARDPQAYLPVVWLHYRSAGCLSRRDDQPLRRPSFLLAAEMAGALGRVVRSAEQRCFATGVMLCTAYTFLEEGERQPASEVFAKVVRVDPGNAAGLLGAAAINERQGRADDAVTQLRQLMEAHPDHAEGRLRLALNLVRSQHPDEAEAELARLLDGGGDPWVRAVAYQELARRLMYRGQPQEAGELLERAVAELPANHTLRIQLALVNDLMGRPVRALELLESIHADADDRGASPRWRYGVWPAFDRASREQRLAEAAAAAEPALAAALAARAETVS